MTNAPEQRTRGGDLAALRIRRDEDDAPRRPVSAAAIGWIVGLSVFVVVALIVYERWIAPARYPVVETTVVRATVNSSNQPLLNATGYLVAQKQAIVAPTITGRVVTLHFDVGTRVRAGDVLAEIDTSMQRTQLREAEANYGQALRDFQRQQKMWKEGIASRAQMEQAQAQLEVAAARRDQINVDLGHSVVRAPFDGIVISKNCEIGEMVSPLTYQQPGVNNAQSGTIATVADLRTLVVEADVNETNLSRIRVGQPAEITVDAFPGKRWRGTMTTIVPAADRAKGIVQVKVAIESPDALLLPDMSATVSFLEAQRTEGELRETARLWVPQSAVTDDPSGSRVMVVDAKNQLEVRPVKAGQVRDGRVEILSGLREGERIVTSDTGSLGAGEKVKLQEAP